LQPESVEEVACGKDGLAAAKNANCHFVDLSSTSQELALKISHSLRQRGIEMLDSPVSGADIGATNGNLTLFVGGSYQAYQRCLPVLQQIGKMVTYLGPNGNGQLGKKINQMMQALSELAIYEGLLLAEKAGLPLQQFARAASAGCAQTWRLDEMVDDVFNLGVRQHRFRLRPGRTGNALKMAEQLGIKLPGTEAAHQVFARHNWEIVIDFDHDKVPE
jgi:3-hydroxyisobutyrate dehydrogenase-like beta-hydroxyacid dehydrogenase